MIYHRRKHTKRNFTRSKTEFRDHYHMAIDPELLKKRKKAKRRRTLSAEIRSGYTMLVIAVIVLNLVLGSTFFIINGQKTVLGYKLKQLQITNENLQDETKIVDGKIVDTQAFSMLEKSAKQREMVEVSTIKYTVGSSRTAKQY